MKYINYVIILLCLLIFIVITTYINITEKQKKIQYNKIKSLLERDREREIIEIKKRKQLESLKNITISLKRIDDRYNKNKYTSISNSIDPIDSIDNNLVESKNISFSNLDIGLGPTGTIENYTYYKLPNDIVDILRDIKDLTDINDSSFYNNLNEPSLYYQGSTCSTSEPSLYYQGPTGTSEPSLYYQEITVTSEPSLYYQGPTGTSEPSLYYQGPTGTSEPSLYYQENVPFASPVPIYLDDTGNIINTIYSNSQDVQDVQDLVEEYSNQSKYMKFVEEELTYLYKIINSINKTNKIKLCYNFDNKRTFADIKMTKNFLYFIKKPLLKSFIEKRYCDSGSLILLYLKLLSPLHYPYYLDINNIYNDNGYIYKIITNYNKNDILSMLGWINTINSIDDLDLNTISYDPDLSLFLENGIIEGKDYIKSLSSQVLENYQNNFEVFEPCEFGKLLCLFFVCYFVRNIKLNAPKIEFNCDNCDN